MPSLLRKSTRDVYLECDMHEHEGTRPAFIVRVMSVGQFLDFADLLERLATAQTNKERLTSAMACVEACVVDWVNMRDPHTQETIPFAIDTMRTILTIEEMTELVGKISGEQKLSSVDEKKSE